MIFKKRFTPKKYIYGLAGVLGLSLALTSLPVQASVKEDNIAANQAITVDSNQWTSWPAGPIVNAESAILMDADLV